MISYQVLIDKIDKFRDEIGIIADDREGVYDERSETWRDSEKGESYQTATEGLHMAVESLQEVIDSLEESHNL